MTPKEKAGLVVVSDDRNKIPLKFKVNLALGSFGLVLKEIIYD